MLMNRDPIPVDENTSRRMRSVRTSGSDVELRLRRELYRRGLRYRVNLQGLPGTPDVAFTRAKVAVFVDGCFWHGCPQHYVRPRANADFWKSKVQRNVERDKETDRVLHDDGWKVIRIWEHEDPVAAADQIAETVGVRRQRSHQSAS